MYLYRSCERKREDEKYAETMEQMQTRGRGRETDGNREQEEKATRTTTNLTDIKLENNENEMENIARLIVGMLSYFPRNRRQQFGMMNTRETSSACIALKRNDNDSNGSPFFRSSLDNGTFINAEINSIIV